MATLNLCIKNINHSVPNVRINDKTVKLKRDKYGRYRTQYDGEGMVEIELYQFYELESPKWWLYALLVWIVGIFGIFSGKFDTKCFKCNYKTTISLDRDRDLELSLVMPQDGGRVINCDQDASLDNPTNIYQERADIAKRAKRYNMLRGISIVVVLAVAVVLILKFVIGI